MRTYASVDDADLRIDAARDPRRHHERLRHRNCWRVRCFEKDGEANAPHQRVLGQDIQHFLMALNARVNRRHPRLQCQVPLDGAAVFDQGEVARVGNEYFQRRNSPRAGEKCCIHALTERADLALQRFETLAQAEDIITERRIERTLLEQLDDIAARRRWLQ